MKVAPLPWLPSPEVGHPGWQPYLRQRAALISTRADELGSLAAAYREQYEIAASDGLGEQPEPDNRRAIAHDIAQAEQQSFERQRPERPQHPESRSPAPNRATPPGRGVALGR